MNIRYLSYDQRKEIEKLYESGAEVIEIANTVGVNPATIYRELKRGETEELDRNGRAAYSAELGQRTVNGNFRRRGNRK